MSDCLGIKFLSDDVMAFLCLARKRAAQMENFTALLSVSIFLLSDYEPLYISADVYFH